ncbi:uncharacterized protein RCC_02344 [Ramularia collo-cygni]|uniref:Methyltransferase domain-containing protein n=1 Tax=Ramularia collo-cygni TaxID=112498 RepID=A0A2D3UMH2_9PEZI|nr:uncharacterized protein RCC_02344 [Ramularia collo-cygni]CZT16502.1 uncharacterized protein RCC_02344 [Ramularia collo-cygni]
MSTEDGRLQTHSSHSNDASDPGFMYKQQWVQDLVSQLCLFVQTNTDWMGVRDEIDRPARVLDYACGNGALSKALADVTTHTTFRGIDSSAAQVQRFNDAAQALPDDSQLRMLAAQGNLQEEDAKFESAEWYHFDVALISMALHHVSSPSDMLKKLASRVSTGGCVVIAEFLTEETHLLGDQGHGKWPGFTKQSLQQAMEQAGLVDVEMRTDPKPTVIPAEFGGNKQIVFAKGRTVAS